MEKFLNSRLMSSVVLAVIIGALCFSVGEGLRLTPFPVSALTQSDNTSLDQYGPLDVPAQPQKRSKRQALDVAGTESAGAHKLVTSFCDVSHYDAVDTGSLLFVPRPEGRAPPSLS